MADRQVEIGTAELEVLNVLWDSGPATVREVLGHLRQRGRRLAYTTVQTFLTRLEHKGYVRSDKSGAAFVYRAAISRERVRRSSLKNLLQQLYDGDAAPLVLQLIKTERFSQEEIAELQGLIDRLDSQR
jgi:predicted transcriptional regulator